jgi:hypothetical protein
MKTVAETEPLLDEDPRPMDRARWQRARLAVEAELIDRAWGCKLYQLHREKRIDNDEREAGDQYQRVIENHRRLQATDPEEDPAGQELAYRRIQKAKDEYNDAREAIGFGRRVLDPLILEEVYPACEKEHVIVKQCLVILKNLFATGTNRQRKKARNVV